MDDTQNSKAYTMGSTSAHVKDQHALTEAIHRVRSDDGDIKRQAWVIVSHVNKNPNEVSVYDEGEGLDEFREKFENDQVMYGLIRLTTSHDMSTTVKFVYVHWIGEKVPALQKGRLGVVHGSVLDHLTPFHLQLETSTQQDLEEDTIIQKLEESSGTRSKVVEGSTAGMQMRGFTQHSVQKRETQQVRSVAPEGLQVPVSDELKDAISQVREDSNPLSWVLACYEEGNVKKPLVLQASGEGDIEELTNELIDDQVMYGLYRTGDEIDEIKTVKFVYIYWVGEKVKPITKGRVSAMAGPIEKIFSPAHVTLFFTNRYDITTEVIADKVTASSGSKSNVK